MHSEILARKVLIFKFKDICFLKIIEGKNAACQKTCNQLFIFCRDQGDIGDQKTILFFTCVCLNENEFLNRIDMKREQSLAAYFNNKAAQ